MSRTKKVYDLSTKTKADEMLLEQGFKRYYEDHRIIKYKSPNKEIHYYKNTKKIASNITFYIKEIIEAMSEKYKELKW